MEESVIAGLIGLLSVGMFGIVWLLMLGFSVGVMALWVWMLVDCVRRQFDDENTRLMWVLIIVLAGWVGAVVYYFVGRTQGVMPEATAVPPQQPPAQV